MVDKGSDRAYTAAIIRLTLRETVVRIAQTFIGYHKREVDGMVGNRNRAYSQCTLLA
jgi:hypothetical protein